MNIILVEDDAEMVAYLAAHMAAWGHVYRHFPDCATFKKGVEASAADFLILDWYLPDGTAGDLIAWARARLGPEIPIMILTVNDTVRDVVASLESGADDYIVKPFDPEVLGARIRALARRAGLSDTTQAVRIGTFVVDPQARVIAREGRRLDLTDTEYRLASYLLMRCGQLLSREELLREVWGIDGNIATRKVDIHISKLRRKLGLTPENGWRLVAVYQHGYRLEQLPPSAVSAVGTE